VTEYNSNRRLGGNELARLNQQLESSLEDAAGVTSVSGGTGIDGTVTTTGSLDLADTAVTPASYVLSSITVDQQGRLTAASSASIPSGATQGAAGASAGQLWSTSSHATLPDNVILIGV